MSLNFAERGTPIAVVRGCRRERDDGKVLSVNEDALLGKPSVKIFDGQFSLVPPRDTRSVVYIFGASGSGKSTFLSNYLAEWSSQHPKSKIIVVSRVAEDEAFDGLPVQRLVIDETLLDEPLTCDDFEPGSFVVFDDIDTITPKKVCEAVYALMADCLNVGRHRNVSVACTSHLGADFGKTKHILNEAHTIVCFPHGSSSHAIRYVATKYGRLSNNDVKRMLKLPSRWVAMKRSYPPVVLYGTGAYLLSAEDI